MKHSAIIFDMDGVLVDSEPVWKEEILLLFQEKGIPLTFEILNASMGSRYDLAIKKWHEVLQWQTPSVEEITQDVLHRMVTAFERVDFIIPGAREAVAMAKESGHLVAIASSSPQILIDTVIDRLALRSIVDVTHSAEGEKVGKPAPDVYLSTLTKLGVEAGDAIAIEDSLNGLRSAKAAGIRCIAIPDTRFSDATQFGDADLVLSALSDMTKETIESLFTNQNSKF